MLLGRNHAEGQGREGTAGGPRDRGRTRGGWLWLRRRARIRIRGALGRGAPVGRPLPDPDAEVRTAAVIQLGTSGGGPEVVSALVTALRDSDRNVVEAAVLALEDQQATSALPALEELSGHSDPEIRELARRAAEYLQLLTP